MKSQATEGAHEADGESWPGERDAWRFLRGWNKLRMRAGVY
jgi:hypothetical protein